MYYTAEDLGYVGHEIAESRRNKVKQIAGGIASLVRHLKQKQPLAERSKSEVQESKSQKVEE